MTKVPLMIIPPSLLIGMAKRLRGIGSISLKFFPGIKYDIKAMELNIDATDYSTISFINALAVSAVFSLLVFVMSYFSAGRDFYTTLVISLAVELGIFMVFLYVLLRYPSVHAGKLAEQIEKTLVFALKDMLLQVSSGMGIFNAIVSISKSNYGEVSKEFERLAKKINGGVPTERALEELSIETKSDYLKRATWQLTNTIKAGADLKESLKVIIAELTNSQKTKISDYAKELNLWSLLYMLFAVAIPTIGIVMLVILGSFAGFQITTATFVVFLLIDIIVQFAIIGFIKSRRPVVYF